MGSCLALPARRPNRGRIGRHIRRIAKSRRGRSDHPMLRANGCVLLRHRRRCRFHFCKGVEFAARRRNGGRCGNHVWLRGNNSRQSGVDYHFLRPFPLRPDADGRPIETWRVVSARDWRVRDVPRRKKQQRKQRGSNESQVSTERHVSHPAFWSPCFGCIAKDKCDAGVRFQKRMPFAVPQWILRYATGRMPLSGSGSYPHEALPMRSACGGVRGERRCCFARVSASVRAVGGRFHVMCCASALL
jgi:hypothetical protein